MSDQAGMHPSPRQYRRVQITLVVAVDQFVVVPDGIGEPETWREAKRVALGNINRCLSKAGLEVEEIVESSYKVL